MNNQILYGILATLVLALLILGSAHQMTEYRNEVFNVGIGLGMKNAAAVLIQESTKCQPIKVSFSGYEVDFISTKCLKGDNNGEE